MSTGPGGGSGGTTRPGFLARVGSTASGYQYRQPQDESTDERNRRERFWRSLGKKIRAGARIRP